MILTASGDFLMVDGKYLVTALSPIAIVTNLPKYLPKYLYWGRSGRKRKIKKK